MAISSTMARQSNGNVCVCSTETLVESPQETSGAAHQTSDHTTEINPQDKWIKRNSSLQVSWNDWMEGGSYQKVTVLLITWHEDENDFEKELLKEEIDALEDVFANQYNFKVKRFKLRSTPDDSDSRSRKRNPQFALNKRLNQFLEEDDDDDSLIIVYYAGHGSPGAAPQSLNIVGSLETTSKYTISWNSAEGCLFAADGNVFVILDCCYASNLHRDGLKSSSFETLAASASETTRVPGKNSFTWALIWALEKFAQEVPSGGFSSLHLRNKICDAPNFPKDQRPSLMCPPDQKSWIRIVLAPLKRLDATRIEQPPTVHSKKSAEIIKLDFHFSHQPDNEEVKKLAIVLRRQIFHGAESLFKVTFDGAFTGQELIVQQVVKHWRGRSNTHLTRPALSQLQIPKSTSSDGQVLLTPTSASPKSASRERHTPRRQSTPPSRRASLSSPLDNNSRPRNKRRKSQQDRVGFESEETPLIRVPDRRFRGPTDEQEVSPEDVGHYFKLFCAAVLAWILACVRPRRRRSVSQR